MPEPRDFSLVAPIGFAPARQSIIHTPTRIGGPRSSPVIRGSTTGVAIPLISLPGLTFLLGNPEAGVAILKSMGPQERDGLIPKFLRVQPGAQRLQFGGCFALYFWAVQTNVGMDARP